MLTRRLVWVAVQDGEVRGVLIAFAGHGIFQPVTLVGRKGERWVLGLLRKAFRDALERGYNYYVTTASPARSVQEAKLSRLMLSMGAKYSDGWFGGQVKDALGLQKKEQQRVAC